MAAVLLGCGLFLLSGCTPSKQKQLEAAVNAINKQFPQQVAEGATLEGFFTQDENIDIAVTLQEEKLATTVNEERLQRMKNDLIVSFTLASRQDKNLHALFQLISDNEKTLSLTITCVPSQKEHSLKVKKEELLQILSAEGMSSEEMAQLQLDQFIQSQDQLLPMEQGPVTCTRIYQKDKSIIWEYVVDENVIDMEIMKSNSATLKHDILEALEAADGLGVVRTALDADCSIVYLYKGNLTGTSFELNLSKEELKGVQRKSVSTQLQ